MGGGGENKLENTKYTDQLPFKPELLGIVLGKKGATVQQIQKQFPQVQIKIVKDSNYIRFEGKDKDVEEAKAAYSKLLADLTGTSVELKFGSELVGMLVGKGGANVRKVESNSGASVRIDRNSGILTVTGSPQAIDKAQTEISDIMVRFLSD